MASSTFSVNVAAICDRARQKMGQGPVTESCGKDPADGISVRKEHADDLVDLPGG